MSKIILGDCLEVMRGMPSASFDGILCDPPYELGFMGKSWDNTGIAFNVGMWAEALRVLKPGAYLLAFSGSRTYHRMACAIEDAGFEIRDMIEWVYGSGFPKSLNIGKAVDKIQGNEREVTDYVAPDGKKRWGGNSFSVGEEPDGRGINQSTKGTSPYEGYGTALKPAHEPCVLARKPLDKGMTVANNVLKHGTGGLNIDGTRVGYGNESDSRIGTDAKAGGSQDGQFGSFSNVKDKNIQMYKGNGRFPANLIHDGSDEVEAVFPQTGKSKGTTSNKGTIWGSDNDDEREKGYSDSGSASRYFYCAKSSKSERNAGLEGFEDIKLDIGDDRPSGSFNERFGHNEPRPTKNAHPTVKPLSLTKYLATLIKPPTGGRLLVPFSGSGSEMIGAVQAGWEDVTGVEITEEYIPIAEARIKYWTNQPTQEVLL